MPAAAVTETKPATPTVTRLKTVHADTTILYFKLRTYHWNVSGKQFFQLHGLFEKLYQEFADINDELAERLVAIGSAPCFTLVEQVRTSLLKEDPAPKTATMVGNTLADLQLLLASLRGLAKEGDAAHDAATMNLADSIADKIEKTIWMLSACLKQD